MSFELRTRIKYLMELVSEISYLIEL